MLKYFANPATDILSLRSLHPLSAQPNVASSPDFTVNSQNS